MQLFMRSVGLFFSILLLGMLPACFNTPEKPVLKTGLIVVNVLDKSAYDDCHIKGSINVPFEQFEEHAKQWDPAQSDVIVYCSNYMCSSSEYAYHQLKRMGFQSIAVYPGGTAEWYQKGFPVNGVCENSYLKQVIAPHADSTVTAITAEELAQKLNLNIEKQEAPAEMPQKASLDEDAQEALKKEVAA